MLIITHSHADGTLISGTTRGDGTAEVLKSNGWKWGRSIASWYVPYSRDRLPKTRTINQTESALRAAGFEVTLDVDASSRPTAEVEAALTERGERRLEHLEHKAQRAAEKSDDAYANAMRRLEQLPPGGEPIKVGHHSERGHRAAITRADTAMRRSIDATATAERAQASIEASAAHQAQRETPAAVARKIEKLAADIRDRDRRIEGHTRTLYGYSDVTPAASGARLERLIAERAELVDQVTYWKDVRAAQIAAGIATDASSETISVGDHVLDRWGWAEVVRVNPKTLGVSGTVRWQSEPLRRNSPYGEIRTIRHPEA